MITSRPSVVEQLKYIDADLLSREMQLDIARGDVSLTRAAIEMGGSENLDYYGKRYFNRPRIEKYGRIEPDVLYREALLWRWDSEQLGKAVGERGASDAINPSHYRSDPSGIECIEITRHRNFNIGAVFKYLWRCGLKDTAPDVEDLKKAAWHLADEIGRLEDTGEHAGQPDHRSEYIWVTSPDDRVRPDHNPQAFADRANNQPKPSPAALAEVVRCDNCLCQFRPTISKTCLECGGRHGIYVEPPALANALYTARVSK